MTETATKNWDQLSRPEAEQLISQLEERLRLLEQRRSVLDKRALAVVNKRVITTRTDDFTLASTIEEMEKEIDALTGNLVYLYSLYPPTPLL